MNKSSELKMRKRKATSDKDKSSNKTASRRSKKAKDREASALFRSLICMCISGFLLMIVALVYIDNDIPMMVTHKFVDNVAKSMGTHFPVYAVVMDAGSTGSRVLAYTFHKAILDGHLVLDKELFEYTKPGISAFVDDPKKAVASIDGLIKKAQAEIPEEYWKETPLILRATAGLRLLPAEKAEALLNAIRAYFKTLPFATTETSVEIMDGTDEGIFSWFTVNFLLHTINSPSKTVAALDLGGGSTQVTFFPRTPASLKMKEFMHEAILPNEKTKVFTNSYLGLGLKAARQAIITYGLKSDDTQVTSVCLNNVIKSRKWHYGGIDYVISGPQENYPTVEKTGADARSTKVVPVVDVAKCMDISRKYIKSKTEPLHELSNQRIFAFSYYFDRAVQMELIDELKGGSITIEQLYNGMAKACLDTNSEQPFLCLDMVYIVSLFTDGYGLDNSTVINMYKIIDGHEISWALGAAYDVLKVY